MAKGKRTRGRIPVQTPVQSSGQSAAQLDGMPLTDAEEQAYETVYALLDEVGDQDARVQLSRRGKDGKLGYLPSYPAIDFSIDRVLQEWGGGRYSISVYIGRERIGSATFSVDESIPRKNPGDPKAEAVGTGAPVAAGLATEIARLQGLIEGMKSAQGALPQAIEIAKLMRGDAHPAQPMNELFGAAKSLFDFVKENAPASGGGGGDDSEGGRWNALIDRAGPLIDVISSKIGEGLTRRIAPATPLPAPSGVPTLPAPIPTDPGSLMNMARPVIAKLLKRAQKNTDPLAAAAVTLEDYVYDTPIEARVAEAAQREDFVEWAATWAGANIPETQAVMPWVREFLQGVRDAFTEGPNPPSEPESGTVGLG